MSCPNTNSTQWRKLVDAVGVREAYKQFAIHGDIPDAGMFPESFHGVSATLKVVGALSTDKMNQVYDKFYASNKDKFYAELPNNGATKDQIQLLKAWNEKNNPQSLADMQAGISAEMSYTVDITEAKGDSHQHQEIDGFDEDGSPSFSPTYEGPSEYYSNMTVPGGTNYRENEIRTPEITPSIQGHAAFSTPNGIGWFRSDEIRSDDKTGKKVSDGAGGLVQLGEKGSKTRRILELQSDLFQKGRDNNMLTREGRSSLDSTEQEYNEAINNGERYNEVYKYNGYTYYKSYNEFAQKFEYTKSPNATPGNNFLQLLNKDNNWVTFFVKSIIQDSTRKGYEEVLFPAGDTAAKVEGHDTIEDYIRIREGWIAQENAMLQEGESAGGWDEDNATQLIRKDGKYFAQQDGDSDPTEISKEIFDKGMLRGREARQRSITQYQSEIEQARAGTLKISSTANFYETTVQNILNKQQYSPERITDEFGNDWFKVKLKDTYKDTIYYNRPLESPRGFQQRTIDCLQKEGLIDSSGNVVSEGPKGAVYVLSHNVERLGAIRDSYYEKNGINPYSVVQEGKGWKVTVNDVTVFNRDLQAGEDAKNITLQTLQKLQEKTGLPFEVITEDRAQALTQGLKNPWNGEGAFYHGGKVYLLEGNLTLENAFHEYSHPFVSALRMSNRETYDRLFSDLVDEGGADILSLLNQVKETYPELLVGSDQYKDEVLVRLISASAEGSMKPPVGFWNKLWFNIKQFFRKVFGQNIDLSKLDQNTSIRDLGDMLLDSRKIAIPAVQEDYVLFNREVAKEMNSIPEQEVMKSIETFHRVALDHLHKLRENQNYEALREVLKNNADGSILNDVSKLMDLARTTEEKMDDDIKKTTYFARGVVGARMIGDKMRQHVLEMNKVEMDDRDRLATMRYYSFIANDWLDTFEQLREINKDDLPLLGNEIQQATTSFKRVLDHTSDAYKKGLVEVLKPQLEPINKFVEEDLKPALDKTRAEVAAGNTKLANRLKYLEKMYEHGRFDENKIVALLQGELGDTNWFSSMFESYSSSPDPIVGGFASYFSKQMYKVEAAIQTHTTELGNKLAPLYKQYGVDVSKPEELGKQLTYLDTVYSKDAEGNPQGVQIHKYLNEFSGGYEYDYQNLQHKLDAAKEGGNKEEAIKVQKELDQLKRDYFHREYVPEIYNVKDFWDESDINRLARQRRKDITDQLAGYEAEHNIKGLTEDDLAHKEELLVQLRTLSSTKNLDGSDKTGDDLSVAQAIQEYNKRMFKYKEEIPMKGSFERDMQTFSDDLQDKGLDPSSDDYKKGVNAWLKENLRVRLSDLFYTSRDKITDEISQIVAKLGQDAAKQLDVSKTWKEMFEQVKGFRDQDNQPVGTDLSSDKIKAVKVLQEKINEITASLRRLNGLTAQEQDRYSEIWAKIRSGNPLDAYDQAEYNEILAKKQLAGLNPVDKARLMALFEELKEFQSKIPTEYYITTMNQKLNEASIPEQVSMLDADRFLDADNMRAYFQNNDNAFTQWFLANHVEKPQWDKNTSSVRNMFERLYIWNRIVPNDENFKNALASNNYQALLKLNNPMVEIRPNSKYYFYRIKNEYRTPRTIGKTVDNRGNWLPRTLEDGAKDGKYRNEQYYRLKNSKDQREQTLFKILQTYKDGHIKSQENAPRYTRLWYEIPRVRKEKIENVEAILESPRRTAKNVIDWAGSKLSWKNKVDAFDSGVASKRNMQEETKMYVATDLFGNQINSIPMKYMSKLDPELVSMDLGRSSIKYALGLQINKTLQEINPIAQALQNTVAEEGIKSINKVSSRNWGLKYLNRIPVFERKNIRLQTITNMIERDIEGVENHMELGLFGDKVSKHLMGVAAFGSLALNLPAGIKNVVVAKLQNLLESWGEFFSPKDLKKADNVFFKRFMPKLIHDYNSFSNRSLETQMFELFDFVQGKFEEHVGESFSASYKKDIAKLRFTRSFQALGELQAQGQAGLAMMIKQLVPWQHEGVTTQIPYLDAWELKNGVIDLKEGIDKSWGKDGDNFAGFKLKMHKINELMQGAYAKMNQAEASRYTSFKMINFMRRYLVPGIVNRFTVNRNNVALGTQREGYYWTTARLAADMARNGIGNWHAYSEKEKRNVYKTLTEIGYSLSFLALISAMGYSSNDPDKNKKMKGDSWAHNMALYELVMIKGEIENFIPWPGMGANEILRMKDQPSIAFPMLNKYYKILSHLIDLAQQPFTDYDITHYRRSTGIYKKGDLKIIADLLKAIGYTGATLHPDNAVKNYMATTARYD